MSDDPDKPETDGDALRMSDLFPEQTSWKDLLVEGLTLLFVAVLIAWRLPLALKYQPGNAKLAWAETFLMEAGRLGLAAAVGVVMLPWAALTGCRRGRLMLVRRWYWLGTGCLLMAWMTIRSCTINMP